MLLADMGEDGITAFIERRYTTPDRRIIKAMGDDTAVIEERAGMALLLTTDTLNEGTHFTRELTTPYLLGSKALAVSLSDIASMGGRAVAYIVSLNLPPLTGAGFLKALYRGLDKQARRCGLSLVGGNLSRADSISITTTVIGEVPPDEVLYRSGAGPGDHIYITGFAGDSALGLKVLKQEGPAAIRKGPYRAKVRKHLEPEPRLLPGRSLARQKIATAMIDTSDGLLLDLERLCRCSGHGAILHTGDLPISRALMRHGAGKAIEMALTGGEDYELLFTTRPDKAHLVQRLSQDTGLRITRIGTITPERTGVAVLDKEGRKIETGTGAGGFTHF